MISNEMIHVIGPALLICSMIVLTHVPLGVEVLKRGIISDSYTHLTLPTSDLV